MERITQHGSGVCGGDGMRGDAWNKRSMNDQNAERGEAGEESK